MLAKPFGKTLSLSPLAFCPIDLERNGNGVVVDRLPQKAHKAAHLSAGQGSAWCIFSDVQKNLNFYQAPFSLFPTPVLVLSLACTHSFLDVAMETTSGFHSLHCCHVLAQEQERH